MDANLRKKRFVFRMLMLIALSTAYTLSHSDDPDEDPWYANATDEQRDMYWISPPNIWGLDPKTVSYMPKMPIAFEVGLITKTIPERLIRLINGTDDFKDFANALKRAAFGTLNMNIIPQFALPLIETAINLDTYRNKDIVPFYSKSDAPELAQGGVGATALELAKLTGIDAEKIEHLMTGYTGTLGMYALTLIDSLSRSLGGYPDAPTMNINEYPFLRRFLQDEFPGGDKQEFFALRETLDSLTNSISQYRKSGQFDAISRIRMENAPILNRKGLISRIDRQLANLRTQKIRIRHHRGISSDEKQKRLLSIKERESELLSGIREIVREIRAEM